MAIQPVKNAPPKDAIAGQKRPPSFKGNLRAEPKAPPPVNCSNVETARLPESADRETAAPGGLDGRVAAGRGPGPPVDGDGTAPRRRPPEDLADAERLWPSIVEQAVLRGLLPADVIAHTKLRDVNEFGEVTIAADDEALDAVLAPDCLRFFDECGWNVGVQVMRK